MSGGGSGGGGGDQGSDKDSYALLWIIASLFVIGVLVWHFWSEYLKIAFIALRKYETIAISFFIDNENVEVALKGLHMATPDNITIAYVEAISTFVGGYLMYPICFILILMGLVMLKGNATTRFTKAYNMDTLVQQEKENWPQISPVVNLDLISQDVNQGPWAMAMNPMQFSRHFKLLKVELVPDRKAAWKSTGIPKATLIKENAMQVFASQLGPLWSNVNSLPPHVKALYACFLARAEHDTEACRAYLNKLSRSAAKGHMDYSDTEAFLNKYGNCKAAQLCQKRHAYVLTLMASMLELGRLDGVLATADFLWVKPVDRRLWYTLNCVGRQVMAPEVAGIFAHWKAEKEMERALTVPMVEEATKALEAALDKMIYIPEEDEVIAISQE